MSFDPSSLTEEKSLFAIRKAARRIPSTPFNQVMVGIAAAVSVAYVFLPSTTTRILAGSTRDIAELGFNFSIGILGFLIAGFTIFATSSKERLFIRMAEIEHDQSKLSYLKLNFFLFMRVFIDYMAFCSWCGCIRVFAFEGGPVGAFVAYLPTPDFTRLWLSRIGFVMTAVSFMYVLTILKSFIWNIYHNVMTSIQWAFEEMNDTPAGP